MDAGQLRVGSRWVGWIFVAGLACAGSPARWCWEDPKATLVPTGDLEWKPEPFQPVVQEPVRYIDFEAGDDTGPGTREQPWKHHPWDPQATGEAAAARGIATYVFKRGVVYRGTLRVKESGTAERPIRLLSLPDWGQGEAVVAGSVAVTGWQRGAKHPDIPDPERVWWVDLDFAPRNVWWVRGPHDIVRIPLARTPNWVIRDWEDIKSEWYQFNNPDRRHVWGTSLEVQGVRRPMGIDTVHLTREPAYYEGALIWSEYGWVMGTPYPSRVVKFDPGQRALVFGGQWGDAIGSYHYPRHTRYFLEDKPHYLDDSENGEYWFEPRGRGGRLYLRMPGDRDPTNLWIEAAQQIYLLDGTNVSHLGVSGLTFRFTNVAWDLTALPTRRDAEPGCIRLLGTCRDIRITHNRFEHVHMPIRMKAVGPSDELGDIWVTDNLFQFTDHGGLVIEDGGAYNLPDPEIGRVRDVKVLRNRFHMIGQRPSRYGQGHALEVVCAETLEVAGNVLDRLFGAGIFVFGGKRNGSRADRPLTRILIHHNRVVDSLLNNHDWGGIETWQGGPAYVFGNVSGNPGGFKLWGHLLHTNRPGSSRFGHAYYMDGGFKQYYFNNIAWGQCADPFDRRGNTAAFQEIHGFACRIFNNTVFNFVIGSRRQAPQAGRNQYLGNVWQRIGHMVFRHADPRGRPADPNAADAGRPASDYHHESNAYEANIFHEIRDLMGVFEPDGRCYSSLEEFARALCERGSLGSVGWLAETSPLRDPDRHDFRPTEVARDRGVRVFVPWGLSATVAEWDFIPSGRDPNCILDDHFHMAPYCVRREEYRKVPTYPLRTVNMGPEEFVEGLLEDWIRGALRFNGQNHYAVLAHTACVVRVATPAVTEPRNVVHPRIAIQAPPCWVPGSDDVVRVRVQGVSEGSWLQVDLHGTCDNDRYVGMLAASRQPQQIRGPGPYEFRFRPPDRPNLTHYVVVAFVTTNRRWEGHTDVAQWSVPVRRPEPMTVYRSPSVSRENLLVELVVRPVSGHSGSILLQKWNGIGYRLRLDEQGKVVFEIAGEGQRAAVESPAPVNDGTWHHVVAEADRAQRRLRLYLDGRRVAESSGLGPVSLETSADLYVGGSPEGGWFCGEMDFARIALGTLEDARTTIEEMYAWQFHGPFLKDFLGRTPNGRRDAGALEGD